MTKTETIQENDQQFVSNDYTSGYEVLLNKSNKCAMESWGAWVLGLEFFHSTKEFNPVYMQSLFEENVNFKRYKDAFKALIRNSVTFGEGI